METDWKSDLDDNLTGLSRESCGNAVSMSAGLKENADLDNHLLRHGAIHCYPLRLLYCCTSVNCDALACVTSIYRPASESQHVGARLYWRPFEIGTMLVTFSTLRLMSCSTAYCHKTNITHARCRALTDTLRLR